MAFEDLLGKTLLDVSVVHRNDMSDDDPDPLSDNDYIKFVTMDGEVFVMTHNQDCCENVYLESIVGDIKDLIMTPILLAEVVTNSSNNYDDSNTWTFYKLATIKGYVDLRWYGSSNGFYSESVHFNNEDSLTLEELGDYVHTSTQEQYKKYTAYKKPH